MITIDVDTASQLDEWQLGKFNIGDIDFAPDGYIYHTNFSYALFRIDPESHVQQLVGFGTVGAPAGISSILAPAKLLNELVALKSDSTTFSISSDTTGCPPKFVGKFLFNAALINVSAATLSNIQVEVNELTRHNVLLTDVALIGEGESFFVPRIAHYADGFLSQNDSVDVPFIVCLKSRKSFRLFVDILGIAVTWSTNLLDNNGAESGTLQGWTTDDSAIVIASQMQGETSGVVLPNSGNWFFNMASSPVAPTGVVTTRKLYQDSDIQSYATEIDSDAARYRAETYLQTEDVSSLSGNDWGQLNLYFLNELGEELGTVKTGLRKSSNLRWVAATLEGLVPAGTRTVRFELEGEKHESHQRVFR